jgi:hypothetical protein
MKWFGRVRRKIGNEEEKKKKKISVERTHFGDI